MAEFLGQRDRPCDICGNPVGYYRGPASRSKRAARPPAYERHIDRAHLMNDRIDGDCTWAAPEDAQKRP